MSANPPPTITRRIPAFASVRAMAYNWANSRCEVTLTREANWIQRIGRGDLKAFERLCGSYQNRLFVYLLRMLGCRETTEEVMNDTFHGVWRGAARFTGASKPSTWIFSIARHKALNRLGRKKPSMDAFSENEPFVDTRENVEKDLVQKDLIRTALKKLSREHREVIELTFFSGLSYQEISEIVSCPVNTVKTRMFHAKQQLRAILGKVKP